MPKSDHSRETQEEGPDPQRLLTCCHALATTDADFRKALLDIWMKASPKDSVSEGEALAHTCGDERLIHALRARSHSGDSVVYAHHVFAEIDFLARQYYRSPLHSVLEIGPGTNVGALFCFVASGVPYTAGVDVQELPPPPMTFYSALNDYLACVEGFTWWRYFVTQDFPSVTFPTSVGMRTPEEILQCVDYRSLVPSPPFPFANESFDLIYSVSVMEHVPDPQRLVEETYRLLRPGGLNIHEIALQHHGNADPFQFLAWSEEEYLTHAQPYGGNVSLRGILDQTWTGEIFCNRLRQSDWLSLFQHAGWTVLRSEPIALFDPACIRPERFVEPFKSKPVEDLMVLGVRLVVRCDK